MNELLDTYEPILDLLTAVSAVLVAILAICGVWQLLSLKRGVAAQNERVAKAKAIKYSDRYFSVLVPLDRIDANVLRDAKDYRDKELNLIAAAFITGVADESLGFSLIGRSFCDEVAERYNSLSPSQGSSSDGHHRAVGELYQLWSRRLSKATP